MEEVLIPPLGLEAPISMVFVSLSVPQEKRPDDHRSLEVVAVLHVERLAPKY